MLGKALQLASAGNSAGEEVNFADISSYSWVRFNKLGIASSINARAPFVSPDGTKFYTLDASDRLREYSLSTPYDISTYSSTSFLLTGGSNGNDNPLGMYFKPDGTRLWLTDSDDYMYVWNLTTAWDLSTLSYVGADSFTSPFDNPCQPFWKPDGTQFMAIDSAIDRVRSFSVPTAWDIFSVNTSSYSQSSLMDVSPISEVAARGIFWSNDGTKAYLTGSGRDQIMMWNTDPWDVTDIAGDPDDVLGIGTQETNATGLCFSADGKHLYVTGMSGDGVDQFVRS